MGPDISFIPFSSVLILFQSTGPVWDPTDGRVRVALDFDISIHGSRVGPDFHKLKPNLIVEIFQSTGPVWDPTELPENLTLASIFQSTGPVWDPTFGIAYALSPI